MLYSSALAEPGQKKYKKPTIELFKKVKISVLSPITFYLEDDDYKPVDFNGKMITYTCQLVKKNEGVKHPGPLLVILK